MVAVTVTVVVAAVTTAVVVVIAVTAAMVVMVYGPLVGTIMDWRFGLNL